MANRQRGSRSPAGGRSPASGRNPAASGSSAGRTRRTVPVSRRNGIWNPAAPQEPWTPHQPDAPIYTEPEVRRWPHPLEDEALSAPAPEPALHYIRCALSYQNQLLADIKVLLEQLAAAAAPAAKPEGDDGTLSKV